MKLEVVREELKKVLDFLTYTAKQQEIYIIYCGGYSGKNFVDIFFEEDTAKEKVELLNNRSKCMDDINYHYEKISLNKIF